MKSGIARRACATASLCLVAVCGLLGPRSAAASAPDVWAITGARIVRVSGAPIEKGTVVVRDGLVVSVGASVAVPPDARVIDGTGLTVYPGLVDAFSFVEQEQQQGDGGGAVRGRGGRGAGGDVRAPSLDDPPGVTPDRDVLELAKADGKVEAARNAGITTMLAVPKGGVFRGRSAVLDMNGSTAEAMSVKDPVALHVAFEPQGGFAGFPGSIMGVVAVIRQKLLDASHYAQEWARYSATPRGFRRPEPDEKLAALEPAIDRKLPVVFEAGTGREISRALRIADEFKLIAIVAGGLDAPSVASELKSRNVPVLVSLNFPERTPDLDAETRESLRAIRERLDAPAVGSKLRAAGVRFAFASFGLKSPAQFRTNAIKAVQAGLSKDDALRAMTLSSAEILGVDEQLGSIDEGKIANLLVMDGDLFDEKSKIKDVFVDGTRYEIKSEPPPKPGEQPSTNVTGTWQVTATTPDGPQTVTLTLTQTGSAVTGSFVHPLFGTAEVRSGQVSGNALTFSVTITVEGSGLDLSFTGKVEGNEMSGSVSVPGQGSFPFTGKRTPQGASR